MRYKGFNKIAFALLGILFVLLLFIKCRTPFEISRPQLLEGWNQSVDEENGVYRATYRIDKEMCGRCISFRTERATVAVLIGQESVYHYGKSSRLEKRPGAYQHFISVPEDANGKELLVEINYSNPKYFRGEYQYLFGDSASIVVYLLHRECLAIVLNIIMFLFAIILMVLHILGKKDASESSQNVWMGLLVMDLCMWSTTKLFVTQLILKDSMRQQNLGVFFLMFCPILLINYLQAIIPKLKAGLEYLISLFMILVCIVCHFLGIWAFSSSTRFFAFVVLLCILSMSAKMGYDFYKENEWDCVHVSLIIFLICLLWNLLNVCLGVQGATKGVIIQLGYIVYIVVALVYGAQKLIISAEESKAAEVYKEMAYTDNLTKLQNRHALRKNIERMQLKDICVVSMDLNNLKYYNDNLGHAYGDKLIREAARVIGEIYKDSYRTGGDEFVAILQKVTREQADSYRNQLIRSWKQFNESQDELVLEIASGNGFYNVGDKSYEDIMKRADLNMYYDKSYLKQHSKIKSTR